MPGTSPQMVCLLEMRKNNPQTPKSTHLFQDMELINLNLWAIGKCGICVSPISHVFWCFVVGCLCVCACNWEVNVLVLFKSQFLSWYATWLQKLQYNWIGNQYGSYISWDQTTSHLYKCSKIVHHKHSARSVWLDCNACVLCAKCLTEMNDSNYTTTWHVYIGVIHLEVCGYDTFIGVTGY
jgi:hypothetical protein